MDTIVTLKDLAGMLNISVSTVSKALNGRQDVSKATRRKVTKLAKSHKYSPNISALALRNKSTKTIGVIVPKINHGIYANMVNNIQELGFKKGYRIILLQSYSNIDNEIECINSIKDGCVDGIVIIRPEKFNESSTTKFDSHIKSNPITIVIDEIDKLNGNFENCNILGAQSLKILLNKIEQKKR